MNKTLLNALQVSISHPRQHPLRGRHAVATVTAGGEEKKEVQDAVEERVGGSKTVDDGEIGDH